MNCIKSLRLRSALRRLERLKLNAYRASVGLPPVKSYDICNGFAQCCKAFGRRVICCCLQWGVTGTNITAFDYLLTDGTLPNRTLKAAIGMLCGAAIAFILTPILQDIHRLSHPTLISVSFGTFVGLGLAFSQNFRLLTLLVAPQIFTNQARIVLLGYALALAMSGPGTNYVKNLEILTNSIHICMDMLNESFKDIADIVRNPMSAVTSFFKTLKSDIEDIFQEFKNTFSYLKASILSVVDAIKEAYRWLEGVTEMCNMDFGTPYDRCKVEFGEAAADCVDKVGEAMSFMCHVDALDDLCELTKVVDYICMLPNLLKENVFRPIVAELDKILETIKEFFDARIHASYDLDMDLNASKSASQVLRELKADVLNELHWLLWCFNSLDALAALGFVAITIGSALYYRHWYLNSDHHDNKYITRGMVRLDLERRRVGRDGIFPLNYKESQEYVQVWSLRMLKEERKKFKRNFLLVVLSSIPILSYICLDAGLYQLLVLIQRHGAIRIDIKETIGVVNISGDGFMADVDRIILRALQHLEDALPALDTTKCLPNPLKPNYLRYIFIGLILLLCLFLVFTEAYGLRLRQYICSIYYPDRQIHRDKWLYIHILSARGSFFKYARDQIMAKLSANERGFRVGLLQRFLHTCPGGRKLFWLLQYEPEKQCVLCGKSGDMDDDEVFHECPTCGTVYCMQCFEQVEERCPLCNASMEEDSIDEESGSDSESAEDYEANAKTSLIKPNEGTLEAKLSFDSVDDGETEEEFAPKSESSDEDEEKMNSSISMDTIISDLDLDSDEILSEHKLDLGNTAAITASDEIISTGTDDSTETMENSEGGEKDDDEADFVMPTQTTTSGQEQDVSAGDEDTGTIISDRFWESFSVGTTSTSEEVTEAEDDKEVLSVTRSSSMSNYTREQASDLSRGRQHQFSAEIRVQQNAYDQALSAESESLKNRRKSVTPVSERESFNDAKSGDTQAALPAAEFDSYLAATEREEEMLLHSTRDGTAWGYPSGLHTEAESTEESETLSDERFRDRRCRCLHYRELDSTFYSRYDEVLQQMVSNYPEFEICQYPPLAGSTDMDSEAGTQGELHTPYPSQQQSEQSNDDYVTSSDDGTNDYRNESNFTRYNQ